MRVSKFTCCLALAIIIIMMIPAVACAGAAYLGSSGNPIKPEESSDIVLEKHIMQIWLHRGFAEVENVYQLYNTGEDQAFMIGEPEDMNSQLSLQYGILNFRAYVDGNEVDVRKAKTKDQVIGKLSGNINWHVHNVLMTKGQRVVIVHTYWITIPSWKPKLFIPLEPAASWKGNVAEASYVVNLMDGLSIRNLIYPKDYSTRAGEYAIMPRGFEAGNDEIRWFFANQEPAQNLEIMIFPSSDKKITKAEASETYSEGNKNYLGKFVADGDPTTAWGFVSTGKKEWVTLFFDRKRWVREIRIISGYGALESMYKFYNRPKVITLSFSDGTSQQIKLKDSLDMQYVSVKPVQTEYVKLQVDDVYKGIHPYITFVSELEPSEIKSVTKFSPTSWKIGLKQFKLPSQSSNYTLAYKIGIAATAVVFLVIGWQITMLLINRFKSKVS